MKTATKKIGTLLFMLAGFTPLLFVLFFSFKQQMIRQRMQRKLEQQQLHSITIADNKIQWAEKGKEIWVDGKLFDVEEMEKVNGSTIFYGLYDEEETQLKEIFNTSWKKDLANQNHVLAKIFQCLNGFYCNCLPQFNDLSEKTTYTFSYNPPHFPAWVQPILTPPPQA